MSNQNIYDNQEFFDSYKKLRGNPSEANDIVKKPVCNIKESYKLNLVSGL